MQMVTSNHTINILESITYMIIVNILRHALEKYSEYLAKHGES